MDSIFLFGEGDRSAFLQHMMQSFGSTYVCLWSYLPHPSNCLLYLDGVFRAEVRNIQQPSSSSGSIGRRLFNAYSETIHFIDQNGRIPGFAFKNNLPYMELKLLDFRRMASSESQMQFYQEAGVKTVVFMGCAMGEIELGTPNETPVDLEMKMKAWFPIDFVRQTSPTELMIPQTIDHNQPPSSSSSSLRSLSFDSVEHSPLGFNLTSTPFVSLEPSKESHIREGVLKDARISYVSTSLPMNDSTNIQNINFPTNESEEAVMTSAILAVLSSPSTSSSSVQNLPPISPGSRNNPSAFRSYRASLAPFSERMVRHNMFGRAISFFKKLSSRTRQELLIQENRPTTTQLHHMISERRRREKLNESFQILRSLLPPGSKKDKASVLSHTTEYLSALKSQMAGLSKRNMILEALQVSSRREPIEESLSVERVTVDIDQVSSSMSEARFLDLRVSVRGECSLLNLVSRILELLKQQQRDVSLLSIESNTRIVEESTQVHVVTMRLKIEGDAFDESGFQEAVKKVVDDVAH